MKTYRQLAEVMSGADMARVPGGTPEQKEKALERQRKREEAGGKGTQGNREAPVASAPATRTLPSSSSSTSSGSSKGGALGGGALAKRPSPAAASKGGELVKRKAEKSEIVKKDKPVEKVNVKVDEKKKKKKDFKELQKDQAAVTAEHPLAKEDDKEDIQVGDERKVKKDDKGKGIDWKKWGKRGLKVAKKLASQKYKPGDAESSEGDTPEGPQQVKKGLVAT